MSRREVKVRIRAWLEARELDGLAPELRAKVEVERHHAYESVRPSPRSVDEIHEVLDRLLTEAGLVEAGPVETGSVEPGPDGAVASDSETDGR